MNGNYERIAKNATIIFIVLYLICIFVFGNISEIGRGLNGTSSNPISITNIARTLSPCFFFSLIPFLVSLYYAKKANHKSILGFDIVMLIIHIVFAFV
jgi:hypothetical protein